MQEIEEFINELANEGPDTDENNEKNGIKNSPTLKKLSEHTLTSFEELK